MTDGGTVVFRRSPVMVYLSGIMAVVWAAGAVFTTFATHDPLMLVAGAVIALVWGAGARLQNRPYASATADAIALAVSPVGRARVLPWTSMRQAVLDRSGVLTLTLQDRESVKLYLTTVRQPDRDALVAEFERHLGSVTRLP